MTVSSDWEDIAWRTHLDAYLTMLRQLPRMTINRGRESSLAKAVQAVDDKFGSQLSFDDPSQTVMEMAELLLNVSELRLLNIAQGLVRLFKRVSKPRKLDIQLMRFSVKRVYADLLSVSALMPSSELQLAKAFRIRHAAVQILAASLLIECSEYLYSAKAFHSTRDYASLISSILLASVAIQTLVSDLLPTIWTASRTYLHQSQPEGLRIPSITSALSVIWPLFVLCSAKIQKTATQAWAGQTLYRIGEEARLPKALHLVRSLAKFRLFLFHKQY